MDDYQFVKLRLRYADRWQHWLTSVAVSDDNVVDCNSDMHLYGIAVMHLRIYYHYHHRTAHAKIMH
jgi:hypothetical protein